MVAIDALKKSGRLLELGCFACHLHLYLNPALIAVPGDTLIPEISDLLIGPQCQAVNAEPATRSGPDRTLNLRGWGLVRLPSVSCARAGSVQRNLHTHTALPVYSAVRTVDPADAGAGVERPAGEILQQDRAFERRVQAI